MNKEWHNLVFTCSKYSMLKALFLSAETCTVNTSGISRWMKCSRILLVTSGGSSFGGPCMSPEFVESPNLKFHLILSRLNDDFFASQTHHKCRIAFAIRLVADPHSKVTNTLRKQVRKQPTQICPPGLETRTSVITVLSIFCTEICLLRILAQIES